MHMTFYANRDADGNVHIQNTLSGQFGQHHVHTPEDFETWKRWGDDIVWLGNVDPCECGLKPGDSVNGLPKRKVS